jgi:2-dehydropantoate 2-reductase
MINNKLMGNKQDNIVIVGQGAMGLLWYHHLSQESISRNLSSTINVNHSISLLPSNQYMQSKKEQRFTHYLFTPYLQNSTETYPLTYSQTPEITAADIIILCLKSYNIADVVKTLTQKISPHCIVILAHNGMGTFEAVANLLPSEQIILAMLTTHGCLRTAPLTITHTGLGQSDIGLLSGKLNYHQQKEVTKQLNNALPEVVFHQDIVQKQWLKLAINCVINPITAINNIDNGEVNDEKYTPQVDSLLAEITKISGAENIKLSLTELKKMVFNVALATAKNHSSMRCDVLAGKPTEIDYINGYVHRLGKKHDIATPENTRLWQQVLDLKKY